MTDHCAYPKCGKELIHIAGRRKKKYCDQKCNSAHWQATHYVPSTKEKKFKSIPIEQYQKSVVFVEDEKGEWIVGDKKGTFRWADAENKTEIKYAVATDASYDGRNNKFENAARGRDENGTNNDELILQYETELKGLGEGKFASARKKWLTNKLNELKK